MKLTTAHGYRSIRNSQIDCFQLPYKDNRGKLIAKLQDAYGCMGMKFLELDGMETPGDIDPYTVFRLFNKSTINSNRNRNVAQLAKTCDVKAECPSDFDGVPVLNNLNATFYAFTGMAVDMNVTSTTCGLPSRPRLLWRQMGSRVDERRL